MLESWEDADGPRMRIDMGGGATSDVLRGAILEAAFIVAPGFLVLLTDDIPHEDGFTIALLAPDGALLDGARGFGIYSTGHVRDVTVVDERRLRFAFFADLAYEIDVLPNPAPALPWWTGARDVTRPWRWTRHMILRHSSQKSPHRRAAP